MKRKYKRISLILLLCLIGYYIYYAEKKTYGLNKLANDQFNTIDNLSDIVENLDTNPAYPCKWIGLCLITAYSSSIDETDSTPFITAYNTQIREGVVACNWLEKGTQIHIEGLGWFVVEDRISDKMARRHGYNVIDIWMPTKREALEFGIQVLSVSKLK